MPTKKTLESLTREVAAKTGLPIKVVLPITRSFLCVLVENMCQGNPIEMRKFGILKLKKRAYRVVRMADEEVEIPEHTVACYTPSENIRVAVRWLLG